MIEKIDRIAIAVKDLNASANFFNELLGVHWDKGNVTPKNTKELGMEALYSSSGLELIASTFEGSIIDKFIKQRGEGLWGLVLKVSDMEAAMEHFASKGMVVVGDYMIGEMREVAYHPKFSHGVEIILCSYPDRHPATVAGSNLLAGHISSLGSLLSKE